MGAIISWILGNPMIILAMIGVFTFTSIASDVKAWWNERHAVAAAVQPWQRAVSERDQAAKVKEGILEKTIEAKLNAEQQIEEFRAHVEEQEIKRKLAGLAECTWSDDDLKLLNAAAGRKGRP
jgi:hypothetical protein